MAKLQELQSQEAALIAHSERLVTVAEKDGRGFTPEEQNGYDALWASIKTLDKDIKTIHDKNTILQVAHATGNFGEAFLGGSAPRYRDAAASHVLGHNPHERPLAVLSQDYYEAFYEYLQSGGTKVVAATYEGSNAGGGFAVPVLTDGTIVPLAPQEMSVRKLAQVVVTANDIKIPIKATFGTAGVKPESGAAANAFTDSDPTIGQFTLSSFMLGRQTTASWELLQDVSMFQQFLVGDLITSVQELEEQLFISGTGTNQPQGMLGNVGTGLPLVANATASDLLTATLNITGELNAIYHRNASYLMNRATGAALRLSQMQSNLYAPVFTTANGQDYLNGFPVFYSAALPTLAAGATPVLFGDLNAGYLIGDRGGAGISVKFLDQPKAVDGQLVLLAYRRTDGRVRRSEAIQPITVAAS